MKTYNRSEFLRFFTDRMKTKGDAFIRPPYNKDAALFSELCPECPDLCARICEEQIIEIAEDGTPFLNFAKNGCTMCEACLNVCEKGVLSEKENSLIDADIHLNFAQCLAWNETLCQSCKDACEVDAIFFEGLKNPNIRKDVCTRCGMCTPICPTNCIEITPKETKQ